jgi:hypothetical protein
MARSPLLGGDRAARRPSGTGTDVLGPSDSSDSGADVQGADADIGDANMDSDSDRYGTGERAQAGRDTYRREAADVGPDRIEGPDETSLDDTSDLESDESPPDDDEEEEEEDEEDEDEGGTEQDRSVDA